MPLPTVNAGDQLLAADHNGVVNQVNTNTSTITTHSSQIATLQGGPTFSGGISAPTVNFTTGSITRMSIFTGSANNAGTTQAHGLGATPDFCVFQETGNAGDTNTFSWDKAASDGTNVKVWTLNATARNYIAICIKQ